MDEYTVNPAVFKNYSTVILNEICTASTGILLYGLFLVLFFLAVHLLHQRKTPGRLTLLILTLAMGLLATTQFALHIASSALALRLLQNAVTTGQKSVPLDPKGMEHVQLSLVLAEDMVLIANSIIADGLFMYRCYLVWDRPRKIFVVLGVVLMIATLATGIVTAYDQDYFNGPEHLDPRIVFMLNGSTNLCLMMLTAGRIWWVSRTARAILGSVTPRYSAATAIILESGALVCCGFIFQIVALSIQDTFPILVYLSHGTIGQLVNIAPMLIIVRVGLGHAVPTTTTRLSRTGAPTQGTRSLAFAAMRTSITNDDHERCSNLGGELGGVPLSELRQPGAFGKSFEA